MSGEEFDSYIRRKLRIGIIALIAGFVISGLGISLFVITSGGRPIENGDVSNWMTLLIEIAVALAITIIVWVYTTSEQIRMNNVLSRINMMTGKLNELMTKQDAFRENRYKYVLNRIRSNLSMVKFHANRVDTLASDLLHASTGREHIESDLADTEDQLKYFVTQVRQDTQQFADVLEAHIVTELMRICDMASLPTTPPEMRPDYWVNQLDARAITIEIDKLLDGLSNMPI